MGAAKRTTSQLIDFINKNSDTKPAFKPTYYIKIISTCDFPVMVGIQLNKLLKIYTKSRTQSAPKHILFIRHRNNTKMRIMCERS